MGVRYLSHDKKRSPMRLFACFLLLISTLTASPTLIVLGITQDAGYPHAGCQRECCQTAWQNPELKRLATSLAIYDSDTGKRWLFDASPDLKDQLHMLDEISPGHRKPLFSGIFLTHAHIGHYLGLYHLGREVLGTHRIKVYAMKQMCRFLSNNGPWDQLVRLENIALQKIHDKESVLLTRNLVVKPLLVPHRGEYTETVGFKIIGPHKTVLFVPDIDSWDEWDIDINELITQVDIAFLDATFFNGDELPGRNLAEIPHPFVEESIRRFSSLSAEDRNKVHFIHINHSNPLLWNSQAVKAVESLGFHIAKQGWTCAL